MICVVWVPETPNDHKKTVRWTVKSGALALLCGVLVPETTDDHKKVVGRTVKSNERWKKGGHGHDLALFCGVYVLENTK